MDPLVSVIIPVLNASQYLDRCLESIESQTYRNLEIICIDNGSTDDSYNLLLNWSHSSDRVIVLYEDLPGISCARNRGLDIARGDYVFFVDSDDYVSPNLIEDCVSIAKKNGSEIVQYNYDYFYHGEEIDVNEVRTFVRENLVGPKAQPEILLRINSNVWSKCYKRDLLERLSLRFPENIYHAEDISFSLISCMAAQSVSFLDGDCCYFYRRNTPNSSSQMRRQGEGVLEFFFAYQLVLDYLSGSNEMELFKEYLFIRLLADVRYAFLIASDYSQLKAIWDHFELKWSFRCAQFISDDALSSSPLGYFVTTDNFDEALGRLYLEQRAKCEAQDYRLRSVKKKMELFEKENKLLFTAAEQKDGEIDLLRQNLSQMRRENERLKQKNNQIEESVAWKMASLFFRLPGKIKRKLQRIYEL